ncbi:MAG TPA: hypothetical protein VNQ79_12515 [Blastocatellia bacterium]|nr:hypothetical protein [Blastocatellia bacterium]
MKKLSGWMVTLSLISGAAWSGFSVSAAGNSEPPRAAASASPAAAEDSLALLPKSDAVLVIDANRLLNEVLPKIKAAWPQQSEKLTKELDDFITRTGVDLYKVKTISLGLSMSGSNATGALILDGLSLDQAKLDAILKEAKAEKTGTLTYKNKTIYQIRSAKKPESRDGQKQKEKDSSSEVHSNVPGNVVSSVTDTVGLKFDDDTAFAQLDQNRAVLGSQAAVRAVIDAAANPTPNLNSALNGALKETSSTGIIRFAVSVPESSRQWLAGQDYFKDLAALKMVLGAIDFSDDLSLLLDARLRTPSAAEASKIEASLSGLVAIGRMMLGGNQEPLMQALTQLLNEIRISTQTNDVALALKIPRALFDQALKSETRKAENKNQK